MQFVRLKGQEREANILEKIIIMQDELPGYFKLVERSIYLGEVCTLIYSIKSILLSLSIPEEIVRDFVMEGMHAYG